MFEIIIYLFKILTFTDPCKLKIIQPPFSLPNGFELPSYEQSLMEKLAQEFVVACT